MGVQRALAMPPVAFVALPPSMYSRQSHPCQSMLEHDSTAPP